MTELADERGQVDEPYEPFFQDGWFHVELSAVGWNVYDALEGKYTLGPYEDVSVAIDACIILASAAECSPSVLDQAYLRVGLWPR